MSIMLLYAISMDVKLVRKVNKFLPYSIKPAFLHLLYKASSHATKLPEMDNGSVWQKLLFCTALSFLVLDVSTSPISRKLRVMSSLWVWFRSYSGPSRSDIISMSL